MKKKKVIACIFAAAATFAMTAFVSGCDIKTQFDQWTCDHVYDDGMITIEPTCTETGERLYTCLDCGKTYTERVEVIPHAYDIGVITTEPTCTKTGVRTYMCLDCGHEKLETVDKTEHIATTVAAVNPTCETVGYTMWHYCSVCDLVLVPKTQIAALGHTEVTDVAVVPTCTTVGKTAGSHCGTCGKTLVEHTTVQALGHTPVALEGKSPTCTETGLTAGSICSVCNTVLVEQTVIAMSEHSIFTIPHVEPTCTETGLTAGSVCSVCDTVLVEQTLIEATGIHIDDNLDSYCDVCGNIDFAYYQDTANYTTQEYTAWNNLDGNVARLHVASTADDGTVTDNSFNYVTTGHISLTYNREKDVFDYIWTAYRSIDGYGEITHDDIQYSAFEVDGEYYVDVYFTSDVTLSLLSGFVSESGDGENLQPYYENVSLGSFNFSENTHTVLLQIVHNCIDLNADGICDRCSLSNSPLSGNSYRMNYVGANYDNDMSNGYEAWGGVEVVLGDVTNPDYIIILDGSDYINSLFVYIETASRSKRALVSIPSDCATVTSKFTTTEGYYDFYFEPNKDIVFEIEDWDITLTFNTDNLRVKSGELVLVEDTETESVSTLSLRASSVAVTETEDEWSEILAMQS